MADAPRKPPRASHPVSIRPVVPPEFESNWDDDTVPRFELDDPMSESSFDRVTAVPEPPSPSLPSPGPALTSAELETKRPGRGRASLDGDLDLTPMPPGAAEHWSQTPARLGERGDALLELDLGEVARSVPPPAVLVPPEPASLRETQIKEMKDRYAMGDFTGALVVAETMLDADPEDLDAQRYARSCRDVLMQMYAARLGALSQPVRVALPGDQIRWLSLDHRAGFMLSLIDGSSTVEELLDISGMNRLDALRILHTLFDQRVISLG